MKNISNERCQRILQILISEREPITSEELAKKLTVSNRTVRNDLDKVEEYLSKFEGTELHKKPRIGIWLETTDQSRQVLLNSIKSGPVYADPYSSLERQRYIIKRLMQTEELLTMQVLADEIFVSRVTIYKDLEGVEEWLAKYELKLNKKQNYGIEIVGKETNWRKAATALLIELKKDDRKGKESQTGYQRLNPIDLNHIKELIPTIEDRKIENILIQAEKRMKYTISDEAFIALLIHIAISIERIKGNKDIKMPLKQLADLKANSEYEIAAWIANELGRELGVKMPKSEIGYITLHLLGAKLFGPTNRINDPESILNNLEPEIIQLTRDIIALTENILSVDFSHDDNLLTGLALHLRTTVKRLKYGLSLRNPLLDEIKRKFPSIFGAAWATSILFEKNFGIRITEEEIAYLTIHIGAALERMKRSARVLVVCSSGIGTSQLVVSRLEKGVKNLDIVGVTSIHDVDYYRTSEYDFIISTVPFSHPEKQVVLIDVFTTDENIKMINGLINSKNGKNTMKAIKNEEDSIKEIFKEDLIFIDVELDSKEELVKYMGKKLTEKGYVKKGFIESAIKREKLTSTAVGNGVAIPHGEQQFVIKPVIAVSRLKKKIDWSGSPVKIVFLLALKFETGKDTRKFFKKFYNILDDDLVLKSLSEAKSPEQLLQCIVTES
ncbi:MAG: transcription antiterminator [Eubacteriaceae bacterium]|nr:transcription antiterminator [Eubacteriaceae bacterium]